MYRTIVAGMQGRDRGRGASPLPTPVLRHRGAPADRPACTTIHRFRSPRAMPPSARRWSTTSSRPRRARPDAHSASCPVSRPRRRSPRRAEEPPTCSGRLAAPPGGCNRSRARSRDAGAARGGLRGRCRAGYGGGTRRASAYRRGHRQHPRIGARPGDGARARAALRRAPGVRTVVDEASRVGRPLAHGVLRGRAAEHVGTGVSGGGLLDRRLGACVGVPADGEVVAGDPARELILASGAVDLLVLGSRRWGPVRRLALGSTSERVIRRATCPVLVPPRLGRRARGARARRSGGVARCRRAARSRPRPDVRAHRRRRRSRAGRPDALALAKLLSGRSTAELVAVYIYPFDRRVSLDRADAVEAELQEDLLRSSRGAGARRRLGAARHGGRQPLRPGRCRRSAERDASGPRRRRRAPPRRAPALARGDMAAGTLPGAPCAVAVAPRASPRARGRWRTVGVGFDGSR